MKTLYRKVAVSERLPKDFGFYFIISVNGVQKNYWFNGVMFFIDENVSVKYWLEEIPDNTQIEKLVSDKAELLEALEKYDAIIRNRITGADSLEEAKSILDLRKKVESLIQKHKPCEIK